MISSLPFSLSSFLNGLSLQYNMPQSGQPSTTLIPAAPPLPPATHTRLPLCRCLRPVLPSRWASRVGFALPRCGVCTSLFYVQGVLASLSSFHPHEYFTSFYYFFFFLEYTTTFLFSCHLFSLSSFRHLFCHFLSQFCWAIFFIFLTDYRFHLSWLSALVLFSLL